MKKTIITLGLVTAVGIGGIFTGYKFNSFVTANANSYDDVQSPGINNNNAESNSNSNYYNNNAGLYNNSSQDSMGDNPSKYLYKNGKLEQYNESEASQDGSVTISTDQFKEGDKIDIKVDDSM